MTTLEEIQEAQDHLAETQDKLRKGMTMLMDGQGMTVELIESVRASLTRAQGASSYVEEPTWKQMGKLALKGFIFGTAVAVGHRIILGKNIAPSINAKQLN